MNSLIFMLVIIIIPLIFMVSLIPYWTRKTESFGVSIPEEEHDNTEIKSMRKWYAIYTAILMLVATAIFISIVYTLELAEDTIGIIYTILIFVYMGGSFLIYLFFHKKMKSLKENSNWKKERRESLVVDTSFRSEKKTYSNKWFLIALFVVVATVFVSLINYDSIPDKIPMNYDFSGEITNWADKSYRSLMLMPVTQMFLIALFLFVNVVISRAKQQISAQNPQESTRKNIVFRKRWSLFTIISGNILVILFSLIQLSLIYSIDIGLINILMMVFTLGIIIGAIVLSITTGQGGSRLKSVDGKNGDKIDRDDDKHWKLGVFYYNKNDPAIFLEKRFGIGWTNNWAHPLSWIIIIAIIAIAIGLPLFFSV